MTDKDKPKGIDSDMFLMEMGNIQRFNTLDVKLDWIAYRLMRLTLAFGEGLNGLEVEEYHKLFSKVKEISKE
jgi:hypothetical protein